MKPEEKINILLVDDSRSNLLALEAILQAPDRNLIRAVSGDDALRFLLDSEVAVILMDVYMPGIDGLQTAELIRGRERSRDVPIIFLTAATTGQRHLTRGYSLGAVDYIVKPVEPEILRSKVAVFVDLFKKTREIKRQAQLLHEKNLQLEDANLARLNMLIALGQELTAERGPEQVLKKFCKAARQIVAAEYAAVGLLDTRNTTLRYFFDCGPNSEGGANAPTVSEDLLNALLKNRRPLRLNDPDEIGFRATAEVGRVQSFLGAPIPLSTKGLGWVYLINRIGADGFNEADERLAETLATQVAIAYENAALYAEAQTHASELRFEVAVRKQAEEERAELLTREQAARAEAEAANRIKDEFLSTLSHELRTPLTAILGWSELIRRSGFDNTVLTRALETIERNARSQSKLIDDLLDVSRIITGKIRIHLRPVEIQTVVNIALEGVRPALEAKEIQVETDFDSANCLVLGDGNRLQQVFWNLLNNAVKFTPSGGHVKVAVQKSGSEVQVVVTDSGIGVESEFIPYVFERFRQADGSTTRTHGGLGLGLAIVRHLVELHVGRVEARSEGRNRGATFTVTLPLAVGESGPNGDDRNQEEFRRSKTLDESQRLDGLRILVVDDEADARELIAAILANRGGNVRCCVSAAEALEAFDEWNPDLLVSDVGMPVEDGYSLIGKIRRCEVGTARPLPAIALTAYASSEDRTQALSAGYQMHLSKPVDQKALLNAIATALGPRSNG